MLSKGDLDIFEDMHVGCKTENDLEYEDDVDPADHSLFIQIVS